jgi:hypothetical protein
MNTNANLFDFARADPRQNRLLLPRASAVTKSHEDDAIAIGGDSTFFAVIREGAARTSKQSR